MTADYRFFIKVHNGFPEHPKTGGLSDRAFRNLIELWCYCSRNLTDGIVTKPQGNKILSRKSCSELVAAGYLIEHADAYEMREYLEHQMSAAQVADLREKRAEAGKRGGYAKANRVASATANGKQTPSKSVADKDVDVDKEETTNTTSSPASRGTRLAEDWQPTPELIEKARTDFPTVDLRAETEAFRDWFLAAAGKGSTKVDWGRAWQGWMRRTHGKNTQARTGYGRPVPNYRMLG